MAKKAKTKRSVTTKSAGNKKAGEKKPGKKKAARKTKVTARRKTASRKTAVAKKVRRAVKKKASPAPAVKEIRSPEPSTLSGGTFVKGPRRPRRGMGPALAGQSGDLQGLSRSEGADSESVEELAAEGQYYEAEVVSAVEDALDPDEGEVRTREVPEDDVPERRLECVKNFSTSLYPSFLGSAAFGF